MGGIRTRVRGATAFPQANGNPSGESVQVSAETGTNPTQSQIGEITVDQLSQAFSRANSIDCDPIPCLSKQSTMTKVMSSRLGKAGSVGLGKAIEVLDTLGSSMADFNHSSSFTKGVSMKGSKISILCFEVAKTIVKGSKLMRSLSKDSIDRLKTVVLSSEGVNILVSEDMDECLRIVAADKREELELFARQVVHFGNRCRDPQWHNLDRYFEKLFSELTQRNGLNAESMMQQLMTLVQYTAELFNEMYALDQLDQDYQKKFQEDGSNVAQRGDIAIARAELKDQRKLVSSLKKNSLWSKNFEEVVEKLVDIVHFIHLEIHGAFGSADGYQRVEVSQSNDKKLGPAGIAFNYANIIKQIDSLVFLPRTVPADMRDALYQSLPRNMSSELSIKIRSLQVEIQELLQNEAEMMKTLQWLVPIARNTIKAVEGFGWVGGWADFRFEMNRRRAAQTDTLRIETLYHADKEKTEACISQMVIWLHQFHLIGYRIGDVASSSHQPDREKKMLEDVGKKIITPGISKSQNFEASKMRLRKHIRLTQSSRESPSESRRDVGATRWPSSAPRINFDIDRTKALDVIDGLDTP